MPAACAAHGVCTQALFERYGFRVADRVSISKYEASTTERVFLSTVIKDLTRL
jgi:hypothetical protein